MTRARGLPLTPRQREILGEFALHGCYRDVADCLGLSCSTVRQSLSNAYARLGVDGHLAAFRLLGWLTLLPEAHRVPLETFYADLDLVWR